MILHLLRSSPVNKPTGTRGYALIRTSKDAQDKRSQRERIDDWLTRRKLKVISWLEDSGARDLSAKRQNFQRLLAMVQAGEVDWVVISERDRLGFQDAYEYGHFIHIFRTHGTQLWVVSEDKELTNGDRFEPILASLEADKSMTEQKHNADRTLRAKVAAIKRGEWVGGKPPIGYDLVAKTPQGIEVWRLVYEPGKYRRVCYFPDGTSRRYDGKDNLPGRDKGVAVYAEKTKDQALIGWIRKIFRWHIEGIGHRTIAAMLTDYKVPPIYDGAWVHATVTSLLKNPILYSGVPHWNKQGHGRFLELLDGTPSPVARVNGKTKAGRKRAASDYIRADKDRPENAIIDKATWEKAQERFRQLAAVPKKERRPCSKEMYLAGLIFCGDCDRPMSAWAQVQGYRCSTNTKNTKRCRCNRTSHELIEEIVVQHLQKTQKGIEWLQDNPEHSAEILLDDSLELVNEYTREFTKMWREAKKTGHYPIRGKRGWDFKMLRQFHGTKQQQRTSRIEQEVKAKEQERDRLVRRMGLLSDAAAPAVVARINELAAELRDLREQLKPQEDRLEALRDTLSVVLAQTQQTLTSLSESLPKRKAECVRKLISKIVVHHQERTAGTQRRSELVRVEIIPFLGPAADFPGEDSPGRG
jgi:DNA invertase Pin-like site-specific DNA recombinase